MASETADIFPHACTGCSPFTGGDRSLCGGPYGLVWGSGFSSAQLARSICQRRLANTTAKSTTKITKKTFVTMDSLYLICGVAAMTCAYSSENTWTPF